MRLPKIPFLLFWVSYCYAIKDAYLGYLPLENPDLLGGDILGIESFEFYLCVYYMKFFSYRCYSHVGKTGNVQPLSLGEGCGYMGTVTHEFAHALGFFHEQNRSDRDDWLTIFWENIKEGMESQFMKLKPDENQLLTPFDYDSIMLYGSYTFSKDRKNLMTMVGRNNMFLKDVFTKYSMSYNDKVRIKKLYNCEN
ncbi:astacin-like metalloprotease toxin 1 [Nephila pilipes]|uniref:Metalloendopeptidase n=1 Tax=Nephila pilipes TaxID=299642 RepID=A0A8X6T2N2_NEPPI|nr:astacin-like metalloprotease toxin 1 [Nephila pilipes]